MGGATSPGHYREEWSILNGPCSRGLLACPTGDALSILRWMLISAIAGCARQGLVRLGLVRMFGREPISAVFRRSLRRVGGWVLVF